MEAGGTDGSGGSGACDTADPPKINKWRHWAIGATARRHSGWHKVCPWSELTHAFAQRIVQLCVELMYV
jgi:hypothetical protein